MNADEAYQQEQEHQQWIEHEKCSRELTELLKEMKSDRQNETTTKAARGA